MVTCEWAILCDRAYYDSKGKLSILGVVQEIEVQSFPAVRPQMAVAMKLIGEPHDSGQVTLEFRNSDGTLLIETPPKTFTLGPTGGTHFIYQVNHLVLTGPGLHSANVRLDGSLARTCTLVVLQKALFR